MEYKKTLNMSKSGFPMRGGLPMREPDMLQQWYDMDLYHELLKKNDGKPRFALHDGPPFSNGALHMGHALNKCIKDFMIRSAAMRGYYPNSALCRSDTCAIRNPENAIGIRLLEIFMLLTVNAVFPQIK